MSAEWKAVVWGAAIVLFVIAALWQPQPRVSLLALGLVLFTIPFFGDALAAA